MSDMQTGEVDGSTADVSAADAATDDGTTTGAATSDWGRTLAAANETAAELAADGWDVATVRAGHVAPVAPGDGETDRFGLVYLAPDGAADDLRRVLDGGGFDAYEVFRRRVGSDLFVLTRITAPADRRAVVLVGGVDLSRAGDLVAAVRDRGEWYSHVELIDGSHLASFRHDDPALLFPDLS